ncbi:hypothetical protein A2Y83_00510 [Candidatus Falkowbacteria bacterium RBG_13_39_14]|uniref:Glycosyltransferase 2-like domain-containing protein n=1 Tax=Candidatus Falkowbacteria bacterium RBG_13_39_14 TaxID=1797985 RepID=A0A1F5S7A2_9BACT|nr:MAG: hypothetical protein A2Y83_00510 [Candidatus Falkowbacteria bacterium RBG_13_39_14]
MELSIIIVNYKYRDLVKVCLQNLKAALSEEGSDPLPAQAGFGGGQTQGNLQYEIIVVDNGSNDGIEEMLLKNFPEVKLISLDENRGYGGGNNAGMKAACGKYVLILNPDITVLGGAIERMYSFMEAHPEIGILGPQLLNPDGTIQPSCMRFYKFFTPIYRRLSFLHYFPFVKKELDRFEMDDFDHRENHEIEDWIFGPCLMVRKSALDRAGFFDERFLLFFEDTDLCRRFKLAGWKIYYLADAKVIHMDERLSQKSKGLKALRHKTTWIHISSWIKYFWKWRGAAD